MGKTNANDPIVILFDNYYFSTSKQEIISLDKENKSKESFQLTDSTGKVALYEFHLGYNSDKLKQSLIMQTPVL